MRHSRFKGCSKKEDLPSQAQTRPAALCADRGFEGGGTPPHQLRGAMARRSLVVATRVCWRESCK